MTRDQKKSLDSDRLIQRAFYSSVVGRCVSILKDYLRTTSEPSLEGFEWFYIRTKGIKPIVKAINILIESGYSLDLSTEYVRERLIADTFKGVSMEIKAKKWLKDTYNLDSRFSDWSEDSKYCVDLIGENFAIQVKPESYKGSNPSLDKDKVLHLKKHREFESKTGKRVGFIFYDKNNNLKIQKYE